MVIDRSALVAILLGEPEAERLTIALAADPMRCISALSVLETSIVLNRRKGPEAVAELDALVADLGIEIVASTRFRCVRHAWATSVSVRDCTQSRLTSETAAHRATGRLARRHLRCRQPR